MKKKNKNLIKFLTAVTVLLSASAALASEVPEFADSTSLGSYVQKVFTIIIEVAAAIATLAFAIGAVSLIISGDNSEARSDAKDRMKSAVIGLILIIASYGILKTINPQIISLKLSSTEEVELPSSPPAPGVYLFSDSGCKKSIGGPIISSADGYSDIGSIKIIKDDNIDYGAIIHAAGVYTDGGECTDIIKDEGCNPVELDVAHSISVFAINAKNSSGDGVVFYSKPHGWSTGQNAGYYKVADSKIMETRDGYRIDSDEMNFNYTNVDVVATEKYKCTGHDDGEVEGENCSFDACETFQDCPGSIEIRGDYLVALYSRQKENLYCQTFSEDAVNLNATAFKAQGQKLDHVIMLPTGIGRF